MPTAINCLNNILKNLHYNKTLDIEMIIKSRKFRLEQISKII